MTSPIEGFDFSYHPPDFDKMAGKGYRFAVSYLDYRGAPDGKCLTRARVRAIQNAGLALVLNLEVTSGRMEGGRKLGVADATDAANAIAALGLPRDAVVYFSADYDASDFDPIDAYLAGAASILGPGRIGIYGSFRVIRHCQQAGTAKWFWQTYAWSYGKVASGIHAYQHQNNVKVAGGTVDLDWAYQSNFGQVTPELPDSSTQEPDLEIVDDKALLISVPAGKAIFDPLTGAKVTTLTADVQRTVSLRVNGIPNRQSDYYLGRFPDGKSGTPVLAVPVGSATIVAELSAPTADATPFSQADLDAAKAAGSEARAEDIRSRLGL